MGYMMKFIMYEVHRDTGDASLINVEDLIAIRKNYSAIYSFQKLYCNTYWLMYDVKAGLSSIVVGLICTVTFCKRKFFWILIFLCKFEIIKSYLL